MIVLIPYINLLNLSRIIKCLIFRNMEPLRDLTLEKSYKTCVSWYNLSVSTRLSSSVTEIAEQEQLQCSRNSLRDIIGGGLYSVSLGYI